MRPLMPCGGRRTGADSIPAGPRFGGDYGAILGLQAAVAASRQRQDRAGVVMLILLFPTSRHGVFRGVKYRVVFSVVDGADAGKVDEGRADRGGSPGHWAALEGG